MCDKVRIAAVQTDPRIMGTEGNLDKVLLQIRNAANNGVDLVVFPECALSGYVFASREEAMPFMDTIPGLNTDTLITCCNELGVHVIIGLLESDAGRCYNSAVLIGPQGLVGKYRKNHLPFLGIDRFIDPGDNPFQVFETPIGRIGMHICYDCTFPESARVMTLLGVDIIALLANFPEGRENVIKYVINTRAYENKVHLVAVNRVGRERGTRFIGSSKIVNAWGDTLVQATSDDEQIISAEVSLAEARQKRIVFEAGKFEIDRLRDRRPELYGEISRIVRAE